MSRRKGKRPHGPPPKWEHEPPVERAPRSAESAPTSLGSRTTPWPETPKALPSSAKRPSASSKSTALAAHLGISLASVSHVLNGYRNDQPSPQFRKGLVELTDEATAAKIIDAIPAPVKKKRRS